MSVRIYGEWEDSARLGFVKAQHRAAAAGRSYCDSADIALALLVPSDGMLPVIAAGDFPQALKDACASALQNTEPFLGILDTSCFEMLDRAARGEAARRRVRTIGPAHVLVAIAREGGPGAALLAECGLDLETLDSAVPFAEWPEPASDTSA